MPTINSMKNAIKKPSRFTSEQKAKSKLPLPARKDELIARVKKDIRGFSEKLVDEDVIGNEEFMQAAYNWVATYKGDFEYVKKLCQQLKMDRALSIGQLRGALNCMRAEAVAEAVEARDVKEAVGGRDVRGPVPNGTYTVTGNQFTKHVTVRLAAAMSGTGQVGRLLVGADNAKDFVTVAKIDGRQIVRMIGGYSESSQAAKALGVVLGSHDPQKYGLAYAEMSGRCSKCGRKLTVPASLYRGQGAKCFRGGEDD